MNPQIRIATQDDVSAITEIYNQAINLRSATADVTAVSIESRRAWLDGHTSDRYPVFVHENDGVVTGFCSLSPYRAGRMALRHTAEISYYIHEDWRRRGIGSNLISHAMEQCLGLSIKTLFAILLDINAGSIEILERFSFEKWGHMPNVADFDGRECGHLYYGRRVVD